MTAKVERHTIEVAHGDWWYCQRGVYGEDSVLAGQAFRQLVTPYPSLEAAQEAHPEAEVSEAYAPRAVVPQTPPSWFDPADAGERWSEDY